MVFTIFGFGFYGWCDVLAKPWGPMFLRFVGHHMRLYPMVANHRSNDAMFAMYPSSLYLDIFQGSISVHSESVSISFSKFNYSYSFQKEENLFKISWRFSKYHFNRKWIYCDSFRQEVNFIQLIDFFFIFSIGREFISDNSRRFLETPFQ